MAPRLRCDGSITLNEWNKDGIAQPCAINHYSFILLGLVSSLDSFGLETAALTTPGLIQMRGVYRSFCPSVTIATTDIQEAAVAGLASCNQLTSKVYGGITGSRLRWSIIFSPGVRPRQSGNWVSTSLGNSGLCWTVFARNRDTAEGNGDFQTLICVLVARPRRCLTLSNPVPWQNWMAAYLSYTLWMRTLFRGWPVMVNDTHTRRRRLTRPSTNGTNDFAFASQQKADTLNISFKITNKTYCDIDLLCSTYSSYHWHWLLLGLNIRCKSAIV